MGIKSVYIKLYIDICICPIAPCFSEYAEDSLYPGSNFCITELWLKLWPSILYVTSELYFFDESSFNRRLNRRFKNQRR